MKHISSHRKFQSTSMQPQNMFCRTHLYISLIQAHLQQILLYFNFGPCNFPLKAQRNVTCMDPANGFCK